MTVDSDLKEGRSGLKWFEGCTDWFEEFCRRTGGSKETSLSILAVLIRIHTNCIFPSYIALDLLYNFRESPLFLRLPVSTMLP